MNSVRAWENGIERTIQRVVAGMITFYAVVVAAWVPTDDIAAHTDLLIVMLSGLSILVIIIIRAWRARLTMTDVALACAAMVAVLRVDAALGSDGIGINGGPAYVFMTTTLLLAALTQSWSRFWLVAGLATTLYVIGGAIAGGADRQWNALDEVISDTSTIAAAGLIMVFYRRAGTRADVALRMRLEMGRREARATALERVASEERRLLHDEVIAALVAIVHCGAVPDPDRAAEVARRGLDALRRDPSQETENPEPHHLVVDTAHIGVAVSVDVDEKLATRSVSADALAAISAAVGEALRNVERHSGVGAAEVRIRCEGESALRISVVDRGRGLPRAFTPGFGIRQSIISRMREVGGHVELRPTDGGGTTVDILWPGDGTAPRSTRLSAITTALGDAALFAYSVTAVAMAGQLWIAGRHLHNPVEVALIVLSVGFTAWVAISVTRRPVVFVRLAGIVICDLVLLCLGLALAGRGALLGFDSWIVEFSCVVIFTLSFFVSFRALMSLAVALTGGMMLWCGIDPAVTVGQASDPILQPIFYAMALGATAAGFLSLNTTAALAEKKAARSLLLEANRAVAADVDADRLARLKTTLEPFLHGVANRTIDVSAPESIERAHALALETRDELYLTGLLDDGLRLLLAATRESGTTVTIRPSTLKPSGNHAITMLRAALDPTTVDEAFLSLPEPASPYTRLVLIPAADTETTERLATRLRGIGATVTTDDHATIITAWSAINQADDLPRERV